MGHDRHLAGRSSMTWSAGQRRARSRIGDGPGNRHGGSRIPRLAVLCDYPEENWPSMELAAEMLVTELQNGSSSALATIRLCPAFLPRVSRLPFLDAKPAARNLDRLLNRMWDYP